MKSKLFCLSLATCALTASSALAAPQPERFPRWYLGLTGGLQFLQDSDLSNGTLEYNSGYEALGSIGYMPNWSSPILNNTRLEFEIGYRSAELDKATISGVSVNAGREAIVWSYMANAYYDFRNSSRWTPYVGVGGGGAQVFLSKSSGLGNTEDKDTSFAYQLMAGVSYAPTSIPLTEWSIGYRYFGVDGADFGNIQLDDLNSHNVEVGAKFRF